VFRFNTQQKVFNISGVMVGGQPGEYPTVMIGSIFYQGEKIVEDEKNGVFNREKAEEYLKREEEISEVTGNPRIVDVCIGWPQAIEKYVDFIADAVSGPFAIDGATEQVRVDAVRYAGEVGLSERVVYNSLTPQARKEEVEALKASGVKSAILLAVNPRNLTVAGRLEVMDNLLSVASQAGIENTLIDVAVFDVPDPGAVGKTIYYVKERYGLPAGAGLHNAVERLRSRRKLTRDERIVALTAANVIPISLGANFILYGPVESAPVAYYGCALADAYVAFNMRLEYRMRPATQNHPLFKVFRT